MNSISQSVHFAGERLPKDRNRTQSAKGGEYAGLCEGMREVGNKSEPGIQENPVNFIRNQNSHAFYRNLALTGGRITFRANVQNFVDSEGVQGRPQRR
jgi:hypothetical protein